MAASLFLKVAGLLLVQLLTADAIPHHNRSFTAQDSLDDELPGSSADSSADSSKESANEVFQDIPWPTDSKNEKKLHDYLNQVYYKIQVNSKVKLEVEKKLFDRLARILTKVAAYEPCFNFDIQFKGSSYEGLKIGKPDEFDFGLVNNNWAGKVVFAEGTPPLPGFGFAVEETKVKNCFAELKEGQTNNIDPLKIGDYLEDLVKRAMKELGMGRDVTWRQGPAVTFEYPSNNPDFPYISVDLAIGIDLLKWPKDARQLSPELMETRAQLVPKPVEGRPLLWQISFSQVEKKIMDKVDHDLGCRRKVLMLAKYLKGSSSGRWHPLSSYHLKMVLFNLIAEKTQKGYWAQSLLVPRFEEFVESLLKNVKEAKLLSYFVPAYNLLEGKPGLVAAKEAIIKVMNLLPGVGSRGN